MANRMPWFRMWNEARNDPKLEILTDAQHRVWHRLMCFASEQDERGVIEYRSTRVLAVQVAKGDEPLLLETLAILEEMEIIGHEEQTIAFVNWGKRQYDKPSDSPDATRQRKREQRDRARQSVPDTNVTPMSRDVTRGHAESRSRGEEKREEQIQRKETDQTETENTWQSDHPPTPARVVEATPPPSSPSKDIAELAQQVQTAANVYSTTIVDYVQRVAPAAAAIGLDLVEQAADYQDKYTRENKTLSASSLKKWINNELNSDRARASPRAQSPPIASIPNLAQPFKRPKHEPEPIAS